MPKIGSAFPCDAFVKWSAELNLRKVFLSVAAAATMIAPTASIAQGIPLIRDAEIEQFIDDYSLPIFRAAGLPEGSIKILIVNDATLNAFAGGRYMGVNTGLITIAETPNQLEGVIAHEAGHLAGGHSARAEDAIANATRPMLLSLVLAAGAIAAGAPEAGIGLLGLGQNVGLANYLKYSRGQESAADQASITYLDKIGHSSKGALELWGNVRNSQIIRGDKINPYLQTHPLANERLTALRERAEASPYFEREDTPEEMARFRLVQAKIHGFLHDPNATLRKYPLTDQSKPAHYARAVAYFRQSHIDRGLSEIRTLTEWEPENPYFHEVEGQLLFESGSPREAMAPYRRSIELLPDNALLRINLGRTILATEDYALYEEAVQEFKRALLLEPDNSFGWFELARAYSGLGNDAMANLATAESRYHAGARQDANSFARRAITGLKRGTPEWRQAADVIFATQPSDGARPLPPGLEEDTPKPLPAPAPDKQEVPDPTVNLN